MNAVAVLAAAALAVAVVAGPAFTESPPAAEWPAVRSEMLVSTGWLAAHAKDKNVVVLCIASSRSFYDEGHIPGARLLLLDDIITRRGDIPNELPPPEALKAVFEKLGVSDRTRVILYGERYGLLAARAYFTLDYLGHGGHTALLDGGLQRWKIERRPLATGEPKVKPGKLSMHLNPAILLDTAAMRATLAASNKPALLDARPLEEFTGEKLSEDVHHAGHIPGARSLYWVDLLVSREDPVFRPPAELRAILAAHGADAGSPVITYCRTGMQSSVDYFVAKYLGLPARMYDGSFFEWSQEDLPAEKSPQ